MSDADLPVILSLSGKGGVGKSLQAVGLATALAKAGQRVGILDLDVRSPNIMYVLGADNSVRVNIDGTPEPKYVSIDGTTIPVFSSGMIFGDRTGIIMDGREMQSLIEGMVYQVRWPELDYMVVDMDPSSGDSLQAITRLMRHVYAFVITTSDVSSLQDCRRMLDACGYLGININGIVGNMVGVECPSCGHSLKCADCGCSVSFGEEQPIIELAVEYKVPYLGSLPWNPKYKADPVASVQGMGAKLFNTLARTVIAKEVAV
jgi:ATP-binding protein involved in chromosome partitioning